jgi:hypothetical protein
MIDEGDIPSVQCKMSLRRHKSVRKADCLSLIFIDFYVSALVVRSIGLSVSQSVKLMLAFSSTVIPGFSLLEIHDQDFYSLLDMYVF